MTSRILLKFPDFSGNFSNIPMSRLRARGGMRQKDMPVKFCTAQTEEGIAAEISQTGGTTEDNDDGFIEGEAYRVRVHRETSEPSSVEKLKQCSKSRQ
jgi:hypothetical protein